MAMLVTKIHQKSNLPKAVMNKANVYTCKVELRTSPKASLHTLSPFQPTNITGLETYDMAGDSLLSGGVIHDRDSTLISCLLHIFFTLQIATYLEVQQMLRRSLLTYLATERDVSL